MSMDMPVRDLENYMGSSKCPKDFNEYWQNILNKRKKYSKEVRIEKSEFETPYCECYDLYFESEDFAVIHVKYLKPKNITSKVPAILDFHGYGGCAKDWTYKLPYVACKIAVFSMDCRGQMGNSTDSFGELNNFRTCNLIRGVADPEKLYYKKVFLDALNLVDIVQNFEYIDSERVATMGYSQGGGIALATAALNQEIKSTFAVYPFLSDYKRCWDMRTGAAYLDMVEYFRKKDPQHKKEDEFFNNLGYVDIQNMAPWIRGSVTMVTGLVDDICPPSTQYATYNKIKSDKKHLLYYDYGHEDMLSGLPDENMKWAMELLKD